MAKNQGAGASPVAVRRMDRYARTKNRGAHSPPSSCGSFAVAAARSCRAKSHSFCKANTVVHVSSPSNNHQLARFVGALPGAAVALISNSQTYGRLAEGRLLQHRWGCMGTAKQIAIPAGQMCCGGCCPSTAGTRPLLVRLALGFRPQHQNHFRSDSTRSTCL